MRDTRAAAYVQPPLSERRLDRQWDRIAARLERGPRARWAAGMISAAAACAVILLAVFGLRRTPVTSDAFVMTALPEGGQELVFADGSRVTVAPGGRLRVDHATPADVAMHLEAGRARFDVKHDDARRFAVHVADFEVVDRGTRFEIVRGDDARPGLEVRVEEGEVELRDTSHREPRRLRAGESWSNRPPLAEVGKRPAEELPAVIGPPVTNGAPPVAAAAPAPAKARTSTREEPSAANSRFGDGRAARPTGDAARAAGEPRAARELFEQGTAAKLEGRLSEAADAFDQLRLRHRADGHAALAALELGRIRLNHLGDAGGALAALQDAVKLGPRAPFREEAEARIVDALAALGRGAECGRAREQFLARHPHSVHASAVAGKCGAH